MLFISTKQTKVIVMLKQQKIIDLAASNDTAKWAVVLNGYFELFDTKELMIKQCDIITGIDDCGTLHFLKPFEKIVYGYDVDGFKKGYLMSDAVLSDYSETDLAASMTAQEAEEKCFLSQVQKLQAESNDPFLGMFSDSFPRQPLDMSLYLKIS